MPGAPTVGEFAAQAGSKAPAEVAVTVTVPVASEEVGIPAAVTGTAVATPEVARPVAAARREAPEASPGHVYSTRATG